MKAADFDINIINHYYELLKNLSKQNKEKLILKLKDSIDSDKNNKNSITHLFGKLSDESAKEMFSEIEKSRSFNRKVEELE